MGCAGQDRAGQGRGGRDVKGRKGQVRKGKGENRKGKEKDRKVNKGKLLGIGKNFEYWMAKNINNNQWQQQKGRDGGFTIHLAIETLRV